MINYYLFVRQSSMAVTASVPTDRARIICKKILSVMVAPSEIFGIRAFQFIFSAPADPTDFADLPLFSLNAVHGRSGLANRRKALKCFMRILPRSFCRINLNVHNFYQDRRCLSALKKDRKRTVIAQPHLHFSPKAASLNNRNLFFTFCNDVVVQLLSLYRIAGLRK